MRRRNAVVLALSGGPCRGRLFACRLHQDRAARRGFIRRPNRSSSTTRAEPPASFDARNSLAHVRSSACQRRPRRRREVRAQGPEARSEFRRRLHAARRDRRSEGPPPRPARTTSAPRARARRWRRAQQLRHVAVHERPRAGVARLVRPRAARSRLRARLPRRWPMRAAARSMPGRSTARARDLRARSNSDPHNPVALGALARSEFRSGRYMEARAFSERRLAAAAADGGSATTCVTDRRQTRRQCCSGAIRSPLEGGIPRYSVGECRGIDVAMTSNDKHAPGQDGHDHDHVPYQGADAYASGVERGVGNVCEPHAKPRDSPSRMSPRA